MRVLTLVAVGLAVLALATAQASASIVQFTDTAQLDYAGVQLNPVTSVVSNGYAILTSSGAPNGTFVRGLRWQSGGFNYAAGISGVSNWSYPYGDYSWKDNFGAITPVTGTDAAALNAQLDQANWCPSGTFAVQAGKQYKLQIFGAEGMGNPNHGNGDFTITVDGNQELIHKDLGETWLYTRTFTANASGQASIFMGILGNNYPSPSGLMLVQVPEPATMSMLLVGGLGALIRRRK